MPVTKAELQAASLSGVAQPSVSTNKPWHRCFARILFDYNIAAWVIGPLLRKVAPTSSALSSTYWMIWVAVVAWLPLEAGLLSRFGTTPGKYLLGLRVLRKDGTRPSFADAFVRGASAWANGCGLLLPVVPIFTFLGQYKRLRAGRGATWDESGGYDVVHTPLSAWRKVMLVCGIVAMIVLASTSPPSP